MNNFSDREEKRNKGVTANIISDTQKPTKGNKEIKKRVSIMVYPSIYENIKKITYVERKSTSALITNLLEQYINENRDKLEEYEKINK